MFKRTKSPNHLETAIARAHKKLDEHEVGSPEYVKVVDQIVKLNQMKNENSNQISSDTLATIGANLVGILLIIRHEHVNVITSRALNMVTKTR